MRTPSVGSRSDLPIPQDSPTTPVGGVAPNTSPSAGVVQPVISSPPPSKPPGLWAKIQAALSRKPALNATAQKTVRVAFNQPRLSWRAKWVLHQLQAGKYKNKELPETSKVIVRDFIEKSLDSISLARKNGLIGTFDSESENCRHMLSLISEGDAGGIRGAHDDLGERIRIFESGVLDDSGDVIEDMAVAELINRVLDKETDPAEILDEAISLRKEFEILPESASAEVNASRADAIKKLKTLETLSGLDFTEKDENELRFVMDLKNSADMKPGELQRFEHVVTRRFLIAKHHPASRERVRNELQGLIIKDPKNYSLLVEAAAPRSRLMADYLKNGLPGNEPLLPTVSEVSPAITPALEQVHEEQAALNLLASGAASTASSSPSVAAVSAPVALELPEIRFGEYANGKALVDAMYTAGGPASLNRSFVVYTDHELKTHELYIESYDKEFGIWFSVSEAIRDRKGNASTGASTLYIFDMEGLPNLVVKPSNIVRELLGSLGSDWQQKLETHDIAFNDLETGNTRKIEIFGRDESDWVMVKIDHTQTGGKPLIKSMPLKELKNFLSDFYGSSIRLVPKEPAP